MKDHYEFQTAEWIWTFAIGLPIFLVTAWFGWRRAQNSVPWRLVLCFVIACIIAPVFYVDDEVTPAHVYIFPAGMMLPYLFRAASRGQLYFSAIPGVFFPIIIVGLMCVAIWSGIIRVKQHYLPPVKLPTG
jgi:hypothetical protein